MTKVSIGICWEWNQCCLFCFLLVFSSVTCANDRLALVIGNSNYEEISPLTNPRNDAEDVAARLRTLGFTLHGDQVHHDLSERSLLRLTSRFSQAAEGVEIALLYFAGHGMQFNGDPHLLPVDVPDDDDLELVQREAIGLNDLLVRLSGRAELTIAIFDACREIPNYQQQIKRATRGGSDAAWRGLSRPKVQTDSTLIAYSGGSGELVADGDGRNSPYTELLLDNLSAESLQAKRLDIPGVFAEVSYQFRIKHNGQRPELINQGVRPNHYYLASLQLDDSGGGVSGFADSNEQVLWQSVVQGNTAEEYRAYLKRYPEGLFADVAHARIGSLKPQSSASDSVNNSEVEVAGGTGRLTVKVEPPDARIRIMNIAPRYKDGIELPTNQKYDIYVTREGYAPWREQVELMQPDQVVVVVLEQRSLPVKPSTQPRLGSYEPEMVLIRGGCYQMGSPESEEGREGNERQHRVCVDDVYTATTETTVGQFNAFVEVTGYLTEGERNVKSKGCVALEGSEWQYVEGVSWRAAGFNQSSSMPVTCVSWNDAQAYVKWLREETGKLYRLPTEAEWEYAARGGAVQARYWGAASGEACGYANVADQRANESIGFTTIHQCNDGVVHTAEVASYTPNQHGLYDMLGNVWEWTCSEWDEAYDGGESQCATGSGGRRSLRGGAWSNGPVWVRSADRSGYSSDDRHNITGFRVFQDIN